MPGAVRKAAAMCAALLTGGAMVSTAVAGPAQQYGHSHHQGQHKHVHQHGQSRHTDLLLTPQLALLDQQRAMLAANPDDAEFAVAVGSRYLELARRSDDLRHLDAVRAVLAPWQHAQQVPASVLLLRATLKQFEHQFVAALEDLQRYLQQAPYDQQAWLSKALIHQVQGDYRLALRSCSHLSGSLKASCRAGSLSLTGVAPAAYMKLLDSVAADDRPRGSDEKIWLLSVLADTALRAGDAEKAEKHFKTLLMLQPDNTQALVNYADLLLEQQRYQAVIALLDEQADVDVLALRLARALAQLQPDRAAILVAQLQQRVASDEVLERGVHLREAAYYFLHLAHAPEQALPLALQNVQSQREPCDIQLVLQSALAANQANAAQPLLYWIEQSGHDDRRIDRLLTRLQQQPRSHGIAGASVAPASP